MKYGQHLKDNIEPQYGPDPYLNYSRLDDLIRILSDTNQPSANQDKRQLSLTTPLPTDAKGVVQQSTAITEEAFYSMMDAEITKTASFTLAKVTELRTKLDAVEYKIRTVDISVPDNASAVKAQADEIADYFLKLEKYVNINFMGFHKILKKHDKYCPATPCKTFYINRMHSQAWVRGDYSDVVVRLSAIYSALRKDHKAEEKADASQSFLRTTTKYWVKTEDVSRVKYAILRNLPVFLQKSSTGDSDSQLTNSVYLDNDQLELYHGRLVKAPGSIALRLRWYGAAEPSTVFVERKTHRDKWIGEVSVKERFIVKEKEVQQVMNGTYPIAEKKEAMLKSGSSQEDADDWEALAREVTQVMVSKQLVPTMRTQYMRTAFQIPFDATVRISLDTNLCMISERGYDLKNKTVWHRDPSKNLAYDEITRFPHAILEIKLELKGDSASPPQWVTDLQNSGMLYEVHKFSKFIHGCAVLLPEFVRAVPYWVDDSSLRDSIIASGGGCILVDYDLKANEKKGLKNPGAGPGANQIYDHLLPFGDVAHEKKDAAGRTGTSVAASKGLLETRKDPEEHKPAVGNYGVNYYSEAALDEEEIIGGATEDETCGSWLFPFCSPANGYNLSIVAPTSIQKVEPKIFFANERTFLHWLHAGVTLYTISASILAFASQENSVAAQWYAMALLPISLGFCMYAIHIFLWRADRIKTRVPGRWDDPRGPIILGGCLIVVLAVNFTVRLVQILKYDIGSEL